MKPERKEELASLYVLDLLEPDEQEAFEALLEQDPALRLETIALERAHEQALFATARTAPPADLFDRIQAEIRSDGQIPDEARETDNPGRAVPFPRRTSADAGGTPALWAWAGWGMAACFMLLFGVWAAFGPGVANRAPDQADLAMQARIAQLESLAENLEAQLTNAAQLPAAPRDNNLTRLVLAPLATPAAAPAVRELARRGGALEQRQMQLTVLAESVWQILEFDKQALINAMPGDLVADRESPPIGYVMLDIDKQMGYLAVDNVPPPQAGGVYHIWVETVGQAQPIFAGILPQLASEQGLLYFDLSNLQNLGEDDRINSIFVTEEPAPNQSEPTGDVILRGA